VRFAFIAAATSAALELPEERLERAIA